ncbi:hypothetical protein SB658_23225, partial [Bacillus sp. SIMBA_008]
LNCCFAKAQSVYIQQAVERVFGTFGKRWLFLDTISHHGTITNVRKTRTKSERGRGSISLIKRKLLSLEQVLWRKE